MGVYETSFLSIVMQILRDSILTNWVLSFEKKFDGRVAKSVLVFVSAYRQFEDYEKSKIGVNFKKLCS